MKVLILEPPNQLLPCDTARPNGSLGPAYLVAALRSYGIEADYYDGAIGSSGTQFFNRTKQENGTVRYGASKEYLEELVAGYDIIATSSIFTAQTRMHFEIAEIVKRVNPRILLVAGGVNARALRTQFLQAGFDIVVSGDGEQKIVEIALWHPIPKIEMDDLPIPMLHKLPLDVYRDIGIPHAGVLPKGTKFASIQTSRGCQDSCTFCHISVEKMAGEGFLRAFSPEYIQIYVDYAVDLGIQRLYFEDDNLFFNKKRLYSLAPILKRPGLEYSNVNGGNLRFLFRKLPLRHQGEVDTDFIAMLRDFGLVELVLPFESRSRDIMQKYATGKYDPDVLDSVALVKALKAAGIRIAGNFMIGFPDEPWESVLRTKDFAKELLDAGLDSVGFMIPVPYPGSRDWITVMQDPDNYRRFAADPLYFTDRMHWRAKPLFPTLVPGEQLEAAVQEFWEELNPCDYVAQKKAETLR